ARFSIQSKVDQKLGWRERDKMEAVPRVNSCGKMFLLVEDGVDGRAGNCCRPLLDAVQATLTEAERRRRLPDDYIDVTQGVLAGWKRRLKRKLLGNFKHAYVDVLSRQQSAFNGHILAALQELTECIRLLDHSNHSAIPSSSGTGLTALAASVEKAVAAGKADEVAVWLQGLLDQMAETRRHYAALEARLDSLQTKDLGKEE